MGHAEQTKKLAKRTSLRQHERNNSVLVSVQLFFEATWDCSLPDALMSGVLYITTDKSFLTRMSTVRKRYTFNMGIFLPIPFLSGNFYPSLYKQIFVVGRGFLENCVYIGTFLKKITDIEKHYSNFLAIYIARDFP